MGEVDVEASGAEKQSVLESPRRQMRTVSWCVACLSILLAVSQVALDVTITANLQPIIITTFGQVQSLPWVNVTFSLANSGSCLMWGKLYDVHDNKWIFLLARAIFAVGSVLTGAAPSMGVLIAGKAITGLGGSGTYIGSIAIISALTTADEKPWYFSYIGMMWGVGTIVGPILAGGFTVSSGGWRWSFYFDAILAGAGLPALFGFLPSLYRHSPAKHNIWSHLRRVDIAGTALFASALTATIMALEFAGVAFPWKSGPVIGLWCAAGCLWVLFGVQQSWAIFTTFADRILPVHILKDWEMWILALQVTCPFGIVFITINYVPLYLQFVRGETALESAIDMLPFLVFTVVAMLISGRLVTTVGPYKVWFLIGSALGLIASGLWYHVGVNTPHGYLYGAMILSGSGLGLYGMSPGPIMAAKVPAAWAPDTGTLFGCADVLSGAIPVAIANTIFVNSATTSISDILPNIPLSSVQEAVAGSSTSFVDGLPPDQRELVLQAVTSAIRNVWIQTIATAALSVVLSICMRTEKVKNIRQIKVEH